MESYETIQNDTLKMYTTDQLRIQQQEPAMVSSSLITVSNVEKGFGSPAATKNQTILDSRGELQSFSGQPAVSFVRCNIRESTTAGKPFKASIAENQLKIQPPIKTKPLTSFPSTTVSILLQGKTIQVPIAQCLKILPIGDFIKSATVAQTALPSKFDDDLKQKPTPQRQKEHTMVLSSPLNVSEGEKDDFGPSAATKNQTILDSRGELQSFSGQPAISFVQSSAAGKSFKASIAKNQQKARQPIQMDTLKLPTVKCLPFQPIDGSIKSATDAQTALPSKFDDDLKQKPTPQRQKEHTMVLLSPLNVSEGEKDDFGPSAATKNQTILDSSKLEQTIMPQEKHHTRTSTAMSTVGINSFATTSASELYGGKSLTVIPQHKPKRTQRGKIQAEPRRRSTRVTKNTTTFQFNRLICAICKREYISCAFPVTNNLIICSIKCFKKQHCLQQEKE